MKKMMALLLASALTVVTMASCTVSIKKNSDNASSSQPAESSKEVSSEETGAKADALFTYQITIDGDTYTLPCSYEDFHKNGWELRGEDEEVPSRTKMLGVYLKKGSESMSVQPVNLSNDTLKLTECPIVYVDVSIKDVTSIELPGGL